MREMSISVCLILKPDLIAVRMDFKLVVTVPVSHADVVREAIGDAGGGSIGNYSHCSFSSRGVGRFKPHEGANPAIGSVGVSETVEEERVEVTVSEADLQKVIDAIKRVHPYEEIALDVYQLFGV